MSESPPAAPEELALTPYIETVYFDDWAPLGLGGSLALTLSPRCTVLVGRNGGGKSLLLEGLRDGAWGALDYVRSNPRLPRMSMFRVDIRFGPGLLRYCYERKAAAINLREGRSGQASVPDELQERCWVEDDFEHPLWSVDQGVLTLNTKETVHLGGSRGSLLAVKDGVLPAGPALASRNMIAVLLMSIEAVQAVMPIRRYGRESITLKGSGKVTFKEKIEGPDSNTAHSLADDLWDLFEEDKERFVELEAVGQRIGIWQKLVIEKYFKDRGRNADVLAEVTVDGINLGLVSDGTLRLLKILLALINDPDNQAPLLIDEPELGIHPALLGRLLAEFDAYGAGRQLVIATHSPQVVSWARPEALRLVERVDGRTVVRSLSEDQARRVHRYLQDQGNLGEFVYGGGVDD